MKIVVIGGTGLIGSKVVRMLSEHGHEAVAASPASGVNTLTGEGLKEVLQDAQVVVDVSNSPSFADDDVMAFFRTATATIEIGGPEVLTMDEWIRQGLAFREDPRTVVTDDEARYFGAKPGADALLPGPGAELGTTRLADWLPANPPVK